ncbi:MAG: dolichyl-phosphooligosaccharide-protein glycotransferase [Archaeoglobi archaeon]|nr:oligosaccharyl transferase, archaeosortase A system-associated [Candidatus Mnemosynella bozhongmuii]MDI3502141.1 dolichyl-phosphooligosaccharide-protein glycotransferase [Archaeoglobi archaeon]MDK2781748.1 dolichyl-phosphooligosaccharide-protein glycotransferase [Archaeoglobi archaeon]
MNREILHRHWHWLFLVSAMIVSIYLRVLNPWSAIFGEEVRFIGNDPWYYSRLIESTVRNFPSRIWFDAFTNFPYGTYTHFGPFVVYFGAFLAKITGASDVESIRRVIAFIPAIGGTLLVLPTYLLVKELSNRRAGVIAAFLVAVMPGQLLYRSLLGFNDHHIWEAFWTVTTLAFFLKSMNVLRDGDLKEKIRNWRTLIFPVAGGISLGMYLLSWAAGFILAPLLLLFIFLLFVLKKYLEVDPKVAGVTGFFVFIVASIIYLPFSFKFPGISMTHYGVLQLLVLLLSALISAVFVAIDLLHERGYFERAGIRREDASSLIILLLGVLSVVIFYLLYAPVVRGIIGVLIPGAYGRTIAEVQPFFIENGEFTLARAWNQFSITFFFSMVSILYLLYTFVRRRDERAFLILIWSVSMLAALAGQIRFSYYFGAVSAVLSGVIADVILERTGFYRFREAEVSGTKKGRKKYRKGADYSKLISGVILILILIFPTASSANSQSSAETLEASRSTINDDWYYSLLWMRENTPNASFYEDFYYQIYHPVGFNERYPYPDEAYGVMSWWDYGHWITAIAHRIPNANPFQQGAKVASEFLTSMNESVALEILDDLGSKYVVTDIEMASLKYHAIRVWAEDEEGYVTVVNVSVFNHTIGLPFNSPKFYSTILGKLHYLDGSGLQHFRLIHESENYVVSYKVANLGTGRIITSFYQSNYSSAADFYSQLRNPALTQMGAYYAVVYDPTPPSSYVKIFERVEGGVIRGTAEETVKIYATIETNTGRTFTYYNEVEPVNGVYEVRVPYSSNMPYDVRMIGDYTIESGGEVRHLSFTEEEIQSGAVKIVNF